MSWYTTGTITVTNGSDIIDAIGSAFLSTVVAGHIFYGPDKELYEVASVTSDTRLVLKSTYNGTTAADTTAWAIIPTQGMVSTLVTEVQDLLSSYATAKAQLESGAFDPGTSSAPGITFTGDLTTGATLSGAGLLALVASGVVGVTVTGTGVDLNYAGAVKATTTGAGLTVNGDITANNITNLEARVTALETP